MKSDINSNVEKVKIEEESHNKELGLLARI
jgi:hypothetical protein